MKNKTQSLILWQFKNEFSVHPIFFCVYVCDVVVLVSAAATFALATAGEFIWQNIFHFLVEVNSSEDERILK